MINKMLFVACFLVAVSGMISPPFALLLGLLFAVTCSNPYPNEVKKFNRVLLQASIIALGFGLNFGQVLRAGAAGLLYTAVSITVSLAVGLAIGRVMRVSSGTSLLIVAGTSICGGSAIAAVAPIIEATEEEVAVSLGTVFSLNCVGLFLFPIIGWMLHLSQAQFGLWSALAIHDTSSVVGATARYGSIALAVGTTVKLARTLWIIPVSLGAAFVKKSSARIHWPWFILFFCGSVIVSTYVPRFSAWYVVFTNLGRMGFTTTLFLIGTGLSKKVVRSIGIRPFLQGLALWTIVAALSLELILRGWCSLNAYSR